MGQRIFVGNLPFSATESQLTEMFGKHGEVSSCEIVKDRMTNRSRGFGFVEMASDDAARAAISALNGQDLDGRPLTVNEARARTEGGGGGGGGRRGGGGGRRDSAPRGDYNSRRW
ncbi:MAG TPA: RNA-binding protein [candidate division WOR-3 bacterium]|uniref:RNA-binding protein n=1 Tax=candidate division WOR-3 bacterium TaxID=2052148 RepID=A0A7V0XEU9_UNCW3|nr:RNA-binding protein [candidate division WOR-3 bacterium]